MFVDLPDTSNAEGISLAAEAILQSVADGDLLPGEATILSNIVEKRRVALETLEFEQRISALEEKK